MTRAPALALAALLALSLAPSLASATTCPGPLTQGTMAPVSGTQTHTCQEIHLTGPWTVPSGGHLVFDHVRLIADSATALLEVQSGGTWDAANSTLQAGSSGYTVRFDAGSHGTLKDTDLSGYGAFEVASDLHLQRAHLTSSVASEALHVTAASPQLEDVTMAAPATGLLVEGVSAPTATRLTVTHAAYAALRLVGPAKATLAAASLQSDLVGTVLSGAASATLHNSTLQGATATARLLHATDGDPTLDLRSTPADPASVERSDAAVLKVGWYARAKVTADPAIHLAQAVVHWEDKDGTVRGNGTVAADGTSSPAFLPDATYLGASATPTASRNPYRAIARGGASGEQSSAGSTVAAVHADLTAPAQNVAVTLPLDEDHDLPVWADAAHALSVDGSAVSGDGNVTLKWSGADDTLGGQHPNRGIALYKVNAVAPSGANRLAFFTGSPGTVRGLATGNYTFYVFAYDLVGQVSLPAGPLTARVDTAQAAITVTPGPAPNLKTDGAWYFNDSFNLTAAAAKTPSGTPALEQRVGGVGAPFAAYTAPLAFTAEGTYNVTFRSTSSSGVQQTLTRLYVLDRQPPLLDVQLDPLAPDGAGGWRVHPLKVTATGSDDGPSGLDRLQLRDGGGAWQDLNGTLTLSAGGDRLVEVRALDRSGNVASTALQARIDATPPTLRLTPSGPAGHSGWFTGATRLAANATDADSGLARLSYSLGDGPWNEFRDALTFNGTGTWHVQVRAEDAAGNAATATQVVAVDGDPPIPPQPDLTALADGRLRIDWSGAPPLDAVSGLASVTLERGLANGSAQPLALRIDTQAQSVGPLPAGEQTLRLVVLDLAGNRAATPWLRVQIPRHAAPDTPLPVRGIQPLAYTPDPGFEAGEVRFLVDGELRATRTEAPYTFQWDTRADADGTHQVRIVAVDRLGAQSEQAGTYEVRNAYLSTLADGALPFGAAAGLAAVTAGLGVASLVLRRRWFPA